MLCESGNIVVRTRALRVLIELARRPGLEINKSLSAALRWETGDFAALFSNSLCLKWYILGRVAAKLCKNRLNVHLAGLTCKWGLLLTNRWVAILILRTLLLKFYKNVKIQIINKFWTFLSLLFFFYWINYIIFAQIFHTNNKK